MRSQAFRRTVAFILATAFFGAATVDTSPVFAQNLGNLLQGAFQSFQLANLTDEQEIQLGGQIVQQAVAKGEIRLSRDRQANDIVRRVGVRIARTSDRPNLPYRFYVVNDKEVNAFSIMGGYVFVTTGLLRTAGSEAELAGVLGHEVGHIVARHSLEQLRQAALAQGVAGALGANNNLLLNIGVGLFQRSYSRNDEYEADKLGVENLARAGYPANGLPDFLRRLQTGKRSPEFLSTHPDPGNRVARLQSIIRTENLPTDRG